MYERRHEPLLPRGIFAWRMVRHAGVVVGILFVCLGIGMVGYHHFEVMPWLDAFGNASMILSGMGPLDRPKTDHGMMFAGFYALFSGVIFLTSFGILLAPIFHRGIHKFHRESSSPTHPAKPEPPIGLEKK